MDDTSLKALLDSSRTVAVVGLSTDPEKTSSKIAQILLGAGYDVIPVHPKATEILGRTAYPTLADVPVAIDIVDVFRPSAETPGIAEQAVGAGAKTLWLQLGIASTDARAIAVAGGLTYLEDVCIGATTLRLGNRAAQSPPPAQP
ncbi:MAG: CoA-binding protein [Actinobacteria bacterium]|nr:CoA-binding protein [Actinomycetota bacterium]